MYILESLMKFFEFWHINEVIVVVVSHVIIRCNKFKLIEMMKTLLVHVFVGEILNFLTNFIFVMVGPVVLEGGYDN